MPRTSLVEIEEPVEAYAKVKGDFSFCMIMQKEKSRLMIFRGKRQVLPVTER
jgi:hypothetical protein